MHHLSLEFRVCCHHSRTSMSIREDYDYDPSLELHVPVSAPLKFAKPVKRSTGQNQSQNKYPSLSTPTARTLGERFHPYNRPYNRPSGSIAFSQQDDNTVSQAPQSKLVKPASSSQKGAERFLSEVKQSLRVQPRPKEEPIETIPSVCGRSQLQTLLTYSTACSHNVPSACSSEACFVDTEAEQFPGTADQTSESPTFSWFISIIHIRSGTGLPVLDILDASE